MKNSPEVRLLLLLLSLLIVPVSLYGFGSEDRIGVVTLRTRPAWVIRDGKQMQIGSFGLNLKKNDLVKTSSKGKVQIDLESGNSILLASNTELKLTQEVIGKKDSEVTSVFSLIFGKIRSKVQKTRKRRFLVKTATATIGVKGTDFVTEFIEEKTRVGTVEGLVNLMSEKTKESIDIPAGSMGSVSIFGELMPLEEFAGELMEGVEIAGNKMTDDDIAGEKIEY